MRIDTLQNVNRGRVIWNSIQKLQIGGRQSLFGRCRFTFWRVPIYILEAEIVLGVLYRKGGKPKKVGTLGSRDRNTKKTPRYHEPFRKVRVNFCPLRCDTSQEPNGNYSEKLVQMNFLVWVDFFGWIFLLFGHFSRGGTLTRGKDIHVAPGMTVRWRSAPCAPPRYCHAMVAQILVVP